MDENMVMENTEVTEPVEELVPEETSGSYELESEKQSGFKDGMVGGFFATGLILGGIALFNGIKKRHTAKKAAKEAEESATESSEGDTEE